MYNFSDIKGNRQLIKNFQSMIFNNKISHAYIIDAPKGSGKKLIGNAFAKAIQCENNKNVEIEENIGSCDRCVSCKTFNEGNHTDIIYVKSENGRATIGVDDIREQIGKIVEIKPYKYDYKIFIIDKADTMTVQAQNALLKTIEEPPSYAVFILLSENHNSFLPTVLSRCVLFKLRPLDNEIVENYIKYNTSIPEEYAYLYSTYAQGNIGKAIEMASSDEFMEIRNMIIRFITDLPNRDFIDVFLDVELFEKYRDDISTVLDILYLCYRDMIMLKCFGDERFIIQKDKKYLFNEILNEFSEEQLFYGARAIATTKRQLNQNANFNMAIENLFLKLKEKR